jgi:hypothetical protein
MRRVNPSLAPSGPARARVRYAPAEVRGKFEPMKASLPGFDICELMPMQ